MNNLLINEFEGPLDLLLHLIKKTKMEIFDIEISEITKQYLNYIHEMEKMDLDIASEYLVMAAELIEIKSKKLIPNRLDEEEQEEYISSEDELKRRLLEYQKYKDSMSNFRDLEEKRSNFYTKSPESLKQYSKEKIENDGSIGIFDLLDAFQKLLERQNYSKPLNTKITRKELSIKDRINNIRQILINKKKLNFIDLFDDFSKPYVVVTFLSILEMAKNKEINLKQDNNFDNIYIERVN